MNWIRERLLSGIEYFFYFAIFLPGILVSTAGLTSYIFLTNDHSPLQLHRRLIERSLQVGAVVSGIGLAGMTGSTFLAAMYDTARKRSRLEFREQDSQTISTPFPYSKCRNCKYYSGKYLLLCAVHPELKVDCQDWEPKSVDKQRH